MFHFIQGSFRKPISVSSEGSYFQNNNVNYKIICTVLLNVVIPRFVISVVIPVVCDILLLTLLFFHMSLRVMHTCNKNIKKMYSYPFELWSAPVKIYGKKSNIVS